MHYEARGAGIMWWLAFMQFERAKAQRIVALLFAVVMVAGCDPRYGFLEAEFTLSDASRLPVWLELPAGVKREDVDVEIKFYTLGKAKIEVVKKDASEPVLGTLSGDLSWTEKTKKEGYDT